jgi:hypothetical protein
MQIRPKCVPDPELSGAKFPLRRIWRDNAPVITCSFLLFNLCSSLFHSYGFEAACIDICVYYICYVIGSVRGVSERAPEPPKVAYGVRRATQDCDHPSRRLGVTENQ